MPDAETSLLQKARRRLRDGLIRLAAANEGVKRLVLLCHCDPCAAERRIGVDFCA
jgi:hypothetical protein